MRKLAIISIATVFILSVFATAISADFYVIPVPVQKKDPNLVPENIKSGVVIMGVIGQLHGGCTCEGTINGTRWCDNGDGTVTDMYTCLVWLKDASCHYATLIQGLKISAETYHLGGCGLSDGSFLGDWHLPSIGELHVLFHGNERVRRSTPRAFNMPSGPPTLYYVSSTVINHLSTDIVKFIDMHDGNEQNVNMGASSYVWPVRGYNWP